MHTAHLIYTGPTPARLVTIPAHCLFVTINSVSAEILLAALS